MRENSPRAPKPLQPKIGAGSAAGAARCGASAARCQLIGPPGLAFVGPGCLCPRRPDRDAHAEIAIARAGTVRTLRGVEIIAHRGASFDAPENTLAAIRLAWAQGADAVEVDVHLTRDSRLAVIHDSDTRRTGRRPVAVADATLAELQQIDVGGWKAGRFAGERIPVLDDVLALVPAGRRIFVELKGGPALVPELVRCLAPAGRGSQGALSPWQLVVISFDLAAATAAKRALPHHEVCWLAETGAEAPAASLNEIAAIAAGAGLDGLDLDWQWPVDGEIVQQFRRHGFKVYVWTVDDASVARRFAALGIDGLTTNCPGRLRAEIALP